MVKSHERMWPDHMRPGRGRDRFTMDVPCDDTKRPIDMRDGKFKTMIDNQDALRRRAIMEGEHFGRIKEKEEFAKTRPGRRESLALTLNEMQFNQRVRHSKTFIHMQNPEKISQMTYDQDRTLKNQQLLRNKNNAL